MTDLENEAASHPQDVAGMELCCNRSTLLKLHMFEEPLQNRWTLLQAKQQLA